MALDTRSNHTVIANAYINSNRETNLMSCAEREGERVCVCVCVCIREKVYFLSQSKVVLIFTAGNEMKIKQMQIKIKISQYVERVSLLGQGQLQVALQHLVNI